MTDGETYCTNEEPLVYSDEQDEVTGWSIWFVWLNRIDQTDLCNHIDPRKARSCA